MSNIDIDYDNHKVSLSLGIEFLHLSVLNTISYDLYALDINQMIFNDKRITFQNLFNLIQPAQAPALADICCRAARFLSSGPNLASIQSKF